MWTACLDGVDILSSLEVVGIHLGTPPRGGRYSPVDGEASPGDPTVGMVSAGKCLLEEWASPPKLGKMGTLEAVESTLGKIRDSGTEWP